LIQKDGGTENMLDMDVARHELEIKQHLGFMFGGVDYYAKTRIHTITEVVRRFYREWDDSIYRK